MLKNMARRIWFVSLIFASTVAVADYDTTTLDSMIIYGESETIPKSMNNRLDRETFQADEMPDLNSVLRSQSGIMVNQGSGQMASNLNLRGAGGQGMVTLDGVPLFSDFVGVYSLQRYPLDVFESITVTRGFSGDSQNSRTLGGAIHLQTRRMQEKDNFLHLEGGSYDTLRSAVGSGLNTSIGDFSAVVGRNDVFSGISEAANGVERDNFGMTHASGNWLKTFNQGSVDASFYFVHSNQGIDGPGLLPNHTFGWVDDKQGTLSDETWVGQLHSQYDVTPSWKTGLQVGFTQDSQNMQTTLIKPFSITNQLFMVDWKNNHFFQLDENKASFVWGVNTQHQNTLNVPSSQTVISPNLHAEMVTGDWKWNANTRFDFIDDYGNHPTFSLGLSRSLSKNMSAWVNGGIGYRQPGVSELMHPIYGNKNLKGEHSTGGEIGWHWQHNSDTELNVSGYYQHYQQMINMQFDPSVGTVRAGNLNAADIWGTEAQLQHHWTNFWKSGLNYSFMSAKNSRTSLRVASLPEHQSVFWNELKLLHPLLFRVEITFHDGYWFDGGNNFPANQAMRVNTQLKYQLTSKTDFYLRGENITDNRTPEVNNFNFNGAAVYVGVHTGF